MDRANDLLGIEMGGQWQLHQNSMHFGSLVELRNSIEKLPSARRSLEVVFPVLKADLLGRFSLCPDVDFRAGVFTYPHHCQAWNYALGRAKTRHLLRELGSDLRSDRFPIDELCHFARNVRQSQYRSLCA